MLRNRMEVLFLNKIVNRVKVLIQLINHYGCSVSFRKVFPISIISITCY